MVTAYGRMVAKVGQTMTGHGTPLAPGPGAVTVLVMGTPAWRIGIDTHACPLVNGVVPHGVGVAVPIGNPLTVIVMGAPVAVMGDQIVEVGGGPNPIL